MRDVLKGNFKVKRNVAAKKNSKEDLEDQFERKAMKRFGGSMAFVSKKKVDWELKNREE